MLLDLDAPRHLCAAARRQPVPGPWRRLIDALMALAAGFTQPGRSEPVRPELVRHSERAWASATFSGSRHSIRFAFHGEEAVEVADRFIEALPDHEFAIPGQIVADAAVVEARLAMVPEPCFEVEVELLLLDDR